MCVGEVVAKVKVLTLVALKTTLVEIVVIVFEVEPLEVKSLVRVVVLAGVNESCGVGGGRGVDGRCIINVESGVSRGCGDGIQNGINSGYVVGGGGVISGLCR